MGAHSPLADIASLARGELDASSTAARTAWLSQHDIERQSTYAAPVPQGVHITAGLARMQTSAPDIGGFEARGPVLSVLDFGAGPAQFKTTRDAGRAWPFGIHMEPEQFNADDGAFPDLPSRLRPAPLQTKEQRGIIGRALNILEPIDPWFQGSARGLVLQARALELIAVAETWLKGADAHRPASAAIVKAEAARDLIESRLADPLTLEVIARAVGVNVRTLSSAFRARYGVSVAAFITDRRMQRAMKMLMDGASVSEAAYAVGYQPNAFSTAFRRQFGVPPSACNGRRPI